MFVNFFKVEKHLTITLQLQYVYIELINKNIM